MGLLLAFMFVWNMIGATVLLPALAHFLLWPTSGEKPGSELSREGLALYTDGGATPTE